MINANSALGTSQDSLKDELRHLSLLYVEDDEAILTSLKRPLLRRLENLYVARNGREGLALYLTHQPDIVITDIRMPEMDGLEMSRAIRETDFKVPIIITSAFDDTQYLLEAIRLGVSRYVLKPVDLQKLLMALESCVRELSLEKQVERKNQELKRHLKMLTEYQRAVEQSTTVCKTTPEGLITDVNDALCWISGYGFEELIGQPSEILLQNPQQKDEIRYFLDQGKVYKGIVENSHKDGGIFHVNLTAVPILNENNQVVEILEFREDITKLINQIYTDPLTNYPNRAALNRDLELANQPLLILLNVNNFKEFNNFYGNEAGDYVLRRMTKVIDAYFHDHPSQGRMYKLSGDEFAVLVEMENLSLSPRQLVRALHDYLESYGCQYEGNEINLSFTSGYTTRKQDALIHADIALRQAKRVRENTACFEDMEDVRRQFELNILWSKKLKQAYAEQRIQPWFQPIVDTQTGRIVKYECLIRLLEKDGQVITPGEFLDIARQSLLYHKLSRLMIERCCQYFADKTYSFALNLSVSDLFNRETLNWLKENVKHYQVGERLVLELLEWESVTHYEQLASILEEIRQLGCRLAIDDFGSGYSNFRHLMKVRADFIKIDGSIIKELPEDPNSLAITRTIVEFARHLGILTVAEHVDREEVAREVRALGIDLSQGFYYGMAAPEISK